MLESLKTIIDNSKLENDCCLNIADTHMNLLMKLINHVRTILSATEKIRWALTYITFIVLVAACL